MNEKLPSSVAALIGMSFTGNVIPPTWYRYLRYDSGKANLNAVVILSEIVYWYRPVEVRDEKTGQLLGYRKKFKADKLQRSYKSFADQFGLTKKQVRDAVLFLEDKGLITKELRITEADNVTLSNVLYLDIIPEKLKSITIPPVTWKSHPCDLEVTPSDSEVIPSLPESQTYTENTTKTTTEIKGESKQTSQSSELADKTNEVKINFDLPPYKHTDLLDKWVYLMEDNNVLVKGIVRRVTPKRVKISIVGIDGVKTVDPTGKIFYQNGYPELQPVILGEIESGQKLDLTPGALAIKNALIDLMPQADFIDSDDWKSKKRLKDINQAAIKADEKGRVAEDFEQFGIWVRDVSWSGKSHPPITLDFIKNNWPEFLRYKKENSHAGNKNTTTSQSGSITESPKYKRMQANGGIDPVAVENARKARNADTGNMSVL